MDDAKQRHSHIFAAKGHVHRANDRIKGDHAGLSVRPAAEAEPVAGSLAPRE